MAGTGSVAYLLKSSGKRVVANDYLYSNYATLVAFIQNSSTLLTDEDVNWLLRRHRKVDYATFIADTFDGFYFKKPENEWLDMVACNISAFREKQTSGRRYKKALALHALVQSCLMKRPFNLFHRRNLYIRTARVDRHFGNKTTWETPFPVLFKRRVEEANKFVFDNGQRNRAMHEDLQNVRVPEADLVYIDPPYFGKKRDRTRSDYRLLYHFVEGLAQYNRLEELLDHSKNLKSLKVDDFSTERLYACEKGNFRKEFLDWLQEVLEAWPNAQIVLSYKQPGVPGSDAIKGLIEKTGRRVSIKRKSYWYALNHQNGSPRHNVELLFIGT